jgi:hypothetical protein
VGLVSQGMNCPLGWQISLKMEGGGSLIIYHILNKVKKTVKVLK